MEPNLTEPNFRKEIFNLSTLALKWIGKGSVTAQNGGTISPFALETFLAMTLIGAKTRAYNEIAALIRKQQNIDKPKPLKLLFDTIADTLLHLNQYDQDLKVEFKIVTAPTLRVSPHYCDNLETLTKIDVETGEINLFTLDYSQEFLRQWLGCSTDKPSNTKMIPVQLITGYTKSILVNTITFNGEWLHQFPSNLTHSALFWLSAHSPITVAMMETRDTVPHIDINFLNASAINLQYKASTLALMIILPHKYDGIQEIEKQLDLVNLREIQRHMVESELLIQLPKFTIDAIVDCKPFLIEHGVETAFTTKADFSELFEPISVPLSNVIQRTRFVVDENGSGPGEAQKVELNLLSAPCFVVNRPFFYFLWDTETEVVLSMGAVREVKALSSSEKELLKPQDVVE